MRLIDADTHKDCECEQCEYEKKDGYLCREACGTIQRIDESPTIDAVPVVRCKDCKCWGNELTFGGRRVGACDFFDIVTDPHGYCYKAVRKEVQK